MNSEDTIIKEILNASRGLNRCGMLDINTIDENELNKQYSDYFLRGKITTCDSCLYEGENGEYILSKSKYSLPLDVVTREIKTKYGLLEWQIGIEKTYHGIEVCILVPKIGDNIPSITKDMDQMGYFFSTECVITDKKGRKWHKIQYEPYSQPNEKNEILSYGNLYHITTLKNIKEILANGLIPQNQNRNFKYPPRVYLISGNASINDIERFAVGFIREKCEKEYAIISIDVNKLPNDTELYWDPNSHFGVFCDKIIPPDALSLYKFGKI